MNAMFVMASVAAVAALLILGRGVYLSVKEAKTTEYTPSGDPVQFTWRDFPQFLVDHTSHILFGFSSIAIAIVFFCIGVWSL